ncbi:MAG: YceI family protein [Bdellovibrionota bacterium]
MTRFQWLKIWTIQALVISLPSLALCTEYEIDSSHSSVTFSVAHLGISTVKGTFKKFKGTFAWEKDKPEAWKTLVTIDPASIDTNDKKRDDHLRNPDFFDVKKFKEITFKSTKVTDVDDEKAKVHGVLTMHGVSKDVILEVEHKGEVTDPWGNKKAVFTGETKVNRKDYGMTWNKSLDKGGLVVGEEVTINLEIEGNAKATKLSKN